MKPNTNVSSFLFVALFFSATFTFQCFHLASATVRSVFIFGDSTVDVGTNTILPHGEPKADYPFFGIDFPHSIPTGRFTNGLNLADFLAKLTGLKISPPPYLALISLPNDLERYQFKGVNFASGGAGLVEPTGEEKNLISVTEQIEQFVMVKNKLIAVMGKKATEEMISKSIFYISIGGKEMFDHFLSSSTVPPQQVTAIQMSQYETYLKALYNLGARNFGIASVQAIGCCPAIRLHNTTGGCADSLNRFSQSFYSALRALLSSLSSQLKGMKYSLGNTYELSIEIMANPHSYGLANVKTACCGAGLMNAQVACNASSNLCTNREDYMFWDRFHPTQKAAQLVAETLFDGSTKYVTPINFRQLVEGINQEVVTSQQVAAE